MPRHFLIGNHEFTGEWISVEDFILRYPLYRLFPIESNLHSFLSTYPQHPISNFINTFSIFQKTKDKKELANNISGGVIFYIRFAFHLLLVDNSGMLEEAMLKRLKDPKNFWGAVYEIFILSYFIKADFKIKLEDETDRSISHCEFEATHTTGQAFSVEAKNKPRDFSSISSEETDTLKPKIIKLLKSALKKDAPSTRLVFINVNMPSENFESFKTYWVNATTSEIKKLYLAKKNGEKWPEAFFILTNFPELTAKGKSKILGPQMACLEVSNFPAVNLNSPHYFPLDDLAKAFIELSKWPKEFEQLDLYNIKTWQS